MNGENVTMTDAVESGTSQYLSFRLGESVFALEIFEVREVLERRPITKMPGMPSFVCGVINVRGGGVPVIDLHRKFGTGTTEWTADTCIIIAEVEHGGETLKLGALADSVVEVFDLDAADMEPAPRMGTHMDTSLIRGMAKRNDEFIIVLDADRVFCPDELGGLVDAAAEAEETTTAN